MKRWLLIIMVSALLICVPLIFAQTAIPVACGTIIEGEFTNDYEEQFYSIELGHGDLFSVDARSQERTGLLTFSVVLYDPEGNWFRDTGLNKAESQYVESDLLFSRGNFLIKTVNTNLIDRGKPGNVKGGIGRYKVYPIVKTAK